MKGAYRLKTNEGIPLKNPWNADHLKKYYQQQPANVNTHLQHNSSSAISSLSAQRYHGVVPVGTVANTFSCVP
ncbi:hypothetical protein LWI29_031413 [Acer saccharum]|uniref:Uncharacterized protein n=1 Tax=Acer saccharum TaxID=4024 RepID=A0AA39VB13_ACESA|nr:hypothetical protein LWI29_031413 [Acer saccharum]